MTKMRITPQEAKNYSKYLRANAKPDGNIHEKYHWLDECSLDLRIYVETAGCEKLRELSEAIAAAVCALEDEIGHVAPSKMPYSKRLGPLIPYR